MAEKTYTLIYTEKFNTCAVTQRETGLSNAFFKDGMISLYYPTGSLSAIHYTYFGEIVEFRLIVED